MHDQKQVSKRTKNVYSSKAFKQQNAVTFFLGDCAATLEFRLDGTKINGGNNT